MKLFTLCVSLAALTAVSPAWSQSVPPGMSAVAALYKAEHLRVERQSAEQEDAARYRVCDVQRAESAQTRTIDFTPAGRTCLIDALRQAASMQGTLVLVRNASATLRKSPDDQALRQAALGAVERARTQLVADMTVLRERFREHATALDQAEISIHLPQLHHQQQQWRLQAYVEQYSAARKDD